MNGFGPGGRKLIVTVVVSLWSVSVLGQMISNAFGREWITPAGLNEITTAGVMWALAVNHQAKKREDEPDPDDPGDPDESDKSEVPHE